MTYRDMPISLEVCSVCWSPADDDQEYAEAYESSAYVGAQVPLSSDGQQTKKNS